MIVVDTDNVVGTDTFFENETRITFSPDIRYFNTLLDELAKHRLCFVIQIQISPGNVPLDESLRLLKCVVTFERLATSLFRRLTKLVAKEKM